DHEDRPDWLEKIDAGTLKVKLAGALVGISGIHLLKSFINISNKDFTQVKWQIVIHVVFLVSTLMLAYTEKILHSSHHKPENKPSKNAS
ncbi:MAG: YqhA family protein, partial [Pseudobdellovibrionaceae bacterium]